MMRYAIAAAPALLLAACGGGGGDSVSLQPGQWETTVQFSSIEIPGAPPEAVQQMRQMMQQPQSRSECITPEQAANPAGNMMNPGGSNCNFTQNTFAGGTINVQGSCQQPGQGNVQMQMQGTYTATTMQANISTEVQAPPGMPGGAQTITMGGTLNARRTGDCPAS